MFSFDYGIRKTADYKRAAVFLDRDGVINGIGTEQVRHVNEPDDFELLDGVGDAIRKFHDDGLKVFVVTNQGGIGLGHTTEKNVNAIHSKMQNQLVHDHNTGVDGIAFCPHRPDEKCACRKPEPRMILDIARHHNIDLPNSYMIGDSPSDVEAGKRAGTKTVLLGDHDSSEGEEADFALKSLRHLADAMK